MEKLGYFAFTALILGFILIIVSCELEQHWLGETKRNKIADIIGYIAYIMFFLFGVYCVYLWISLFYTL